MKKLFCNDNLKVLGINETVVSEVHFLIFNVKLNVSIKRGRERDVLTQGLHV